jgi:hypothetical protein
MWPSLPVLTMIDKMNKGYSHLQVWYHLSFPGKKKYWGWIESWEEFQACVSLSPFEQGVGTKASKGSHKAPFIPSVTSHPSRHTFHSSDLAPKHIRIHALFFKHFLARGWYEILRISITPLLESGAPFPNSASTAYRLTRNLLLFYFPFLLLFLSPFFQLSLLFVCISVNRVSRVDDLLKSRFCESFPCFVAINIRLYNRS